MPYILNTSINRNKKCAVAIKEIFGLGKELIYQVSDQLGFSPQVKYKHLSASQIDRLIRCISQNYVYGTELQGMVKRNKERAVSISSFRGFRYIQQLPCRGQRTHGNAQTARRCNNIKTPAPVKRFERKDRRLKR